MSNGHRWHYKVEKVELDGNSVQVRGLTAGERKKFSEGSKRVAAEEITGHQLTLMVAQMAITEPKLSTDDIDEMPGALLELAVGKILELSGLSGKAEKKAADPSES